MEQYAERKGFDVKDLNIEFINYGITELVYVLTEPRGDSVTILIKQPAVEFGKVWQEAENLIELNKVDSRVIAPIDYFKLDNLKLNIQI